MIGFENPYLLLAALLSLPLLYQAYRTKESKYESYLMLSKSIFIVLAAFALAQPYVQVSTQVQAERNIDIIMDESKSSQLIQNQALDSGIKTQTNSQTIKEIKNSISEERDVLLDSDLQLEMENLQEPLKNYDGSINVVKNEVDTDYSVHIQGPEEAVPGTEVEYKVIVKGTDNDILTPKLQVDGENKNLVKLNKNEWSFEQEFASPGTKEFKATISSQDANEENNKFYQAVDIVEKPEILVLGQQESVSQEIKKVYDVEKTQSLPEDLSKYDSVILKNQKYLKPSLGEYIAEGNGLIYTGKPTESIITPMRPGNQIERDNEVERTSDSIILMDASISRQDGPLRRSKALAYRLLDSMPDSNNAGVAAYNRKGYKLEQLTNLGINRDSLKETISRIEPEGPTFHHQGLKTADNMVGENGNIIMITDGLLSRINRVKGVPEKTINASKQLESELIILDTNPDVNPEFLKNLTREAGGEYVTADNQGTLSFVFQAQQTKDRYSSLYKTDSTHFITRNNILKASVRPRQETKVKRGAQKLIQAESTSYLATWRYGLGRVAQTNDQDSNLDKHIREDPKTVSRIIGWTVGEPREEGYQIESNRKPNPVEIYSREDGNLEETRTHSETGFKKFQEAKYGYNYDQEIQAIGYNQENINYLTNLTEGDEVENPRQWLEQRNSNNQLETVKEQKNMSIYILTIIALLFLAEIGLRKLKGKI